MKPSIQVLGAYGTKAKGFGTSSFYLNKENVIDAGNLLDSLEEKSTEIENIWLTHSHLDHICDIAYILDNYYLSREKSLNIIGLSETIDAVKKHFLNDLIWPDFSKINLHNSNKASISYKKIDLDKEYTLSLNESIKAFKTDHTVESCGYIYTNNGSAVIITADTYSLETTIDEINKDKRISTAIIECSFSSDMKNLAKNTKHLTPKLLQKQLENLKREDIKIYINHMKPYFLEEIKREINTNRAKICLNILKDEEIINF